MESNSQTDVSIQKPENSKFEIPSALKWTRNIDLSDKTLSEYDKMLICEKLEIYLLENQGKGLRRFSDLHEIPKSTLQDWMKKYAHFKKTGEVSICGKRGANSLIDDQGILDIREKLLKRELEQDTADEKALLTFLHDALEETADRRGIVGKPRKLTKETINFYKQEIQVKKVAVQHKSNARIVAERDPRNVFTMHCLVKAFCKDLHPSMIGNFDATQFVVHNERDFHGYIVKAEQDAQNDDENLILPHRTAVTMESTGKLDFAVKYYHVNNANGFSATPVYVIADPLMNDDEFSWHKVFGLGTAHVSSNFGYLCFTKSRACNVAFYHWFAREVLVPFVAESRDFLPMSPVRIICCLIVGAH